MNYDVATGELRQLQLLQLEIAKEVFDICKTNGLEIFLCDGSALGAVRHGGFIPWDDDIDFCMPRKDYLALKKIMVSGKKRDKLLFWADMFTHNDYSYAFAKVMRRGTLCLEHSEINREIQCINVDVFPLDKYPDGNIIKIIHKYIIKFLACALSMKRRNKYPNRIYNGVLAVIPDRFITIALDVVMRFFNWFNTEHMGNTVHIRGYEEGRYSIDTWKYPPSYLFFEQHMFPVPCDYDRYLEMTFGDYMTIPPVEKRKGHGYLKVEFRSAPENE